MSSGASHNASVRWVTCPGCNGKSRYASDNPYRPFCSERCKNHDFGAWASERYRVATKPQDDDESQQIDGDDSST